MNKHGIVPILLVICMVAAGVAAPCCWAQTNGTTDLVIHQGPSSSAAEARPSEDEADKSAEPTDSTPKMVGKLPHTGDSITTGALVGCLAVAAVALGVRFRRTTTLRARMPPAVAAGLVVLLVLGAGPAAARDVSADTSHRETQSIASAAKTSEPEVLSEANDAPEAQASEYATDSASASFERPADFEQPTEQPTNSDDADALEQPAGESALVQEKDAPSQPTTTVTFVANGPACDDFVIEVPGEGGCFPACPFSFDRHEFAGWMREPYGIEAEFVPGEELHAQDEDVFYACWRKRAPIDETKGYDFSSCRLIVALDAEPAYGTVLSAHNGVYLLGFTDAIDAAWAFVDYQGIAEFVSPDINVTLASEGDSSDASLAAALFNATDVCPPALPQSPVNNEVIADLSRIDDAEPVERGAIALIDTGVTGHAASVIEARSVIDETLIDDNGHGTSMLETMLGIDPEARVVSIRALDATGTGSASSVYAAIQMAIEMRVKVINLSLYAPATQGNEAVEQAIANAHAAGIIVVGAAGNAGKDAKWYVPGKMEDACIVGSCDAEGTRLSSSNYGATVDLFVPSVSTSYAAAKVSAWLAAHGTFGQEAEALARPEARAALGLHDGDAHAHDPSSNADSAANGTSAQDQSSANETPPDQDDLSSFTTAWTHPSMQVRAHFSNIGWCSWFTTTADNVPNLAGQSFCVNGVWQNIENFCVKIGAANSWTGGGSIQYRAYYQDTGYDSWRTAPNASPATTGNGKRVEGAELKLTGAIANAYDVKYRVYTLKSANEGRPNANSPCTDTSICHHWFNGSNGSYAGTKGKNLAIEHLSVWLTPKSHSSVVQVRYQDANGNYGSYSNALNASYQTGSTASWSRAQDATYNAASVSWTVTGAATRQVSVSRRKATNTIQVRYQNADGSYGAYTTVSSGSDYVGQVRSWSRAADETFKAASVSITGTASNQTKQVSVERQTYAVGINCLDPTGAETYRTDAIHATLFDVRVDKGTWTQHCFNEPSGFTVRSGQEVTLANLRVRPGYELSAVEGAASAGDGSYTVTVTEATTITIRTKLKQFSLEFDANGGTLQGNANSTGDFGSSVSIPSVHRAGFTFLRWVPVKSDDRTWVEVMYQSPMAAWFANAEAAKNSNELDLYATLGQLAALRADAGWEFLLSCAQWPDAAMRWQQTSDPTTSSAVEGFEARSLSWDANTFVGLSASAPSKTLACANNANEHWWYAVGAYAPFNGGTPVVQELGNTAGVAYEPLHLYVRSDEELSTVGEAYNAGYDAQGSVPVRAYDQTLKAQWKRNRLTVTYDFAGGHSDATLPTEAWEYGEGLARVAELPQGLTRTGYRLLPTWHVGSPTGPTVQAGEELSAQDWASLAGADLLTGDVNLTLYASWEQKDLHVVVPVALHYVAQPDGTVVGPNDGVAYVQNRSELPVCLTESRVEVYDPFSADLSVTVDKSRLEPGECAYLNDVRGTMETPVVDEREVGCIHWTFSVDE